MALSFRFLWLLLLSYFRQDRPVGEAYQRTFRLLPLIDCEFGASLNAAQYFRLAERVQQDINTRCGFTRDGLRLRLWAITLSNTIYYRRALRCWSKITVRVKLVGWNEKFWVWESRFLNSRGELSALSYTKVAVCGSNGLVGPPQVFQLREVEYISSPIEERILKLFESLETAMQPPFESSSPAKSSDKAD